jgi:hypothetical protein
VDQDFGAAQISAQALLWLWQNLRMAIETYTRKPRGFTHAIVKYRVRIRTMLDDETPIKIDELTTRSAMPRPRRKGIGSVSARAKHPRN